MFATDVPATQAAITVHRNYKESTYLSYIKHYLSEYARFNKAVAVNILMSLFDFGVSTC